MQHATEQRNFGALTNKIKYKWKKLTKRAELRLGEEQE